MPDQKPPRFQASEADSLVAFLDYVRESLVKNLDGLSEMDARRELVDSGTTLLSLIRHLTEAEVLWFQIRFEGSSSTEPPDAIDEDLPIVDQVAHYRRAVRKSNEIIKSVPMEQVCANPDYHEVDLRWVAMHMLEEISRHAGHADIIREQTDGSTGR
ncbi:MAG: DinB family protein [Acidimicrobiales bacterium]